MANFVHLCFSWSWLLFMLLELHNAIREKPNRKLLIVIKHGKFGNVIKVQPNMVLQRAQYIHRETFFSEITFNRATKKVLFSSSTLAQHAQKIGKFGVVTKQFQNHRQNINTGSPRLSGWLGPKKVPWYSKSW